MSLVEPHWLQLNTAHRPISLHPLNRVPCAEIDQLHRLQGRLFSERTRNSRSSITLLRSVVPRVEATTIRSASKVNV